MGMVDLAPFAVALNVSEGTALRVAPARRAVVSWNTYAARGALRVRLSFCDGTHGEWHEYARWSPDERSSCRTDHETADGVRIAVDIIESERAFDRVEVRGDGIDFTLLAASAPVEHRESLPYAADARILDVAPRSQYVVDGERGWCSPTALSMLCAYFGIDVDVESTARAVFDSAYGGTGNWAFNAAFGGALGLRTVVAHLANLDHAARLIERDIPIAISYAWTGDELPGAPIEHSDGHLAVLCGFTTNGDCVMNDPAAPSGRAVYGRRALERVWQRAGGIAYVAAPAGKEYFDVLATP